MHPSMMFHPPMLYSGYTLMAIPFAFAIGALITGKLGPEWIRDTRRFLALGAWLFLGVGIIPSVPAGPTRSSAGAGTGVGIRWRTRH